MFHYIYSQTDNKSIEFGVHAYVFWNPCIWIHLTTVKTCMSILNHGKKIGIADFILCYVKLLFNTIVLQIIVWTPLIHYTFRAGWPDRTNFGLLGDCLLWLLFLKITEVARIFGLLFLGRFRVVHWLWQKMTGWATFWAIVSQTHLVILGPMLWFFKYFHQIFRQKNLRFWLKTKLNYAKFWS
jgi:hypothetical protein